MRIVTAAGVFALLVLLASRASYGAFGVGNLVVVQVGDGSTALSSAAAPAFLKEFTPAGVLVQTIPLPTTAAGSNFPLTMSGLANNGFMKLSANGQYLTTAGYAAPSGTASVESSNASGVGGINRVVAVINVSTSGIDTSTALTDAYNGGPIRSAITSNGVDIWTGGASAAGQEASAGTRYTSLGGTTSIGLHNNEPDTRSVNIFAGQLYNDVVPTFGPIGVQRLGVGTVGTGLPTAPGATFSYLPAPIALFGADPNDFWFRDANTLYVADQGGPASGLRGITKWLFDGDSWELAYNVHEGTAQQPDFRIQGLSGTIDANGNSVLYCTRIGGTTLVAVTDLGPGSPATIIATAPANTAFRGVAIVPEPSALILFCLGIAALSCCHKGASRR